MHAVVDDLTAAITAIGTSPNALAAFAEQVNEASPPPAPSGPALSAASARLRRELPVPAGEHPYLDEIRLALQAAAAAMAALASTSDGEQTFTTARSRLLDD